MNKATFLTQRTITLVAFIFTLLVALQTQAQEDWRLKVNDEWFIKEGIKGLTIGDTMPDIFLGTFMNSARKKVSDYKGKLLILDFWSTYCGSCIEKFPEMEKLQSAFGDKIQIVLVNQFETKKQIEQRKAKIKLQLPDLPIIVGGIDTIDKLNPKQNLANILPIRGVPHHVWIDGSGIIRLRGEALNTNHEKISRFLNGEDVYVLADISTVPSIFLDPTLSYYSLVGDFKHTKPAFSSIITPFNNELNSINGPGIIIKKDTIGNINRAQFLNFELLDIYRYLFRMLYPDQFNREKINYAYGGEWNTFILIPPLIDTLNFTTKFSRDNNLVKLSDTDHIRSLYCYELVSPGSVPDSLNFTYAISDLNRYVLSKENVSIQFKQITLPYYALVSLPKIEKKGIGTKPSLQSITQSPTANTPAVTGETDIATMIKGLIEKNPALKQIFEMSKKENKLYFIVNESGSEYLRKSQVNNDPKLKNITTVAELENYLIPMGLKLEIKSKPFIVMALEKVN